MNGIWCNGNTTDSGPVIPGSNPGIPTERELMIQLSFFCLITNQMTAGAGIREALRNMPLR